MHYIFHSNLFVYDDTLLFAVTDFDTNGGVEVFAVKTNF